VSGEGFRLVAVERNPVSTVEGDMGEAE